MPRKNNDYYDSENKVQYTPQTWECDKCEYQTQVLSAIDVSHRCPKNEKKPTFLKRVDKKVIKKVTKTVKKVDEETK